MSEQKLEAIVLQQGGSTSEWYTSGHNNMAEAQEAVRGHEEASYSSVALAVPEALAKNLTVEAEVALLALLKSVAEAAVSIG